MQEPNAEELQYIRLAIEDELMWRRDNHVFVIRNNGLCIREKDSTPSDIIRMSHEEAFLIGWNALVERRTTVLEPGPGFPVKPTS